MNADRGEGPGRYAMGLDGGGSKTLAVVGDRSGNVLGWAVAGPSNDRFVSRSVARRAVASAVSQALGAARIVAPQVASVRAAIAGSETVDREAVASGVRGWRRVHEHEACLAAALCQGHAAVALAGTGAFEWANGPGGTHRTDGLGSLLGDEGSAYWLACRALVRVGRAIDGRAPPTELVGALMAAAGVRSRAKLGSWLYRGRHEASRHEVAALAVAVTAAAAAGDRAAVTICRDGAYRLAAGVLTCVRATGLADARFPVVMSGGVMAAGAVIGGPFQHAVRRGAPGARFVVPRYVPAIGALRLALEAMGAVLDEGAARRMDRGQARMDDGALVPSGACPRRSGDADRPAPTV